MYRKGIPTGDPNCPEEVCLAKRIKYDIGDRAAIGDGEEEFNLEDTSFTATKPNPDAPLPIADPPLDDGDNNTDNDDDPVLVYDEAMVPRQPQPSSIKITNRPMDRFAPMLLRIFHWYNQVSKLQSKIVKLQ